MILDLGVTGFIFDIETILNIVRLRVSMHHICFIMAQKTIIWINFTIAYISYIYDIFILDTKTDRMK